MDYTSRWNDFQFRSPVYMDGRIEPYKFDLVKWEHYEPIEVKDLLTGEKKMSDESCFVVGTLIWNPKEEDFEFESCGLRFLEYYIDGLNKWITAFAEMKRIELKSKDCDNECVNLGRCDHNEVCLNE